MIDIVAPLSVSSPQALENLGQRRIEQVNEIATQGLARTIQTDRDYKGWLGIFCQPFGCGQAQRDPIAGGGPLDLGMAGRPARPGVERLGRIETRRGKLDDEVPTRPISLALVADQPRLRAEQRDFGFGDLAQIVGGHVGSGAGHQGTPFTLRTCR